MPRRVGPTIHLLSGRATWCGGEPITEQLVETLTSKAEEGFDVHEILRRRGERPTDVAGLNARDSYT